MFKRNNGQGSEKGDLSTKPKFSKLKTVITVIVVAAFVALLGVIKLNHLFHWWLTPPW